MTAESVTVKNKNLFVNTDRFACVVTVAKDGKEIRRADLPTAVEPLSEQTYPLPFAKETKAGEYTVTVSFHLKADTVWAKAGHEVAFGQYVYPVAGEVETCTDKIKVIHSTHNIGVEGAHFFRPVFRIKRWAGFLQICGKRDDRGDPETKLLAGTDGQ